MNKNRFLLIVPLAFLLACSFPARMVQEAFSTPVSPVEPTRTVPPPEPSLTVQPPEPSSTVKLIRPTRFVTDIPESGPVPFFSDVREQDLSNLGSLGEATILTLWFNGTTTWHDDDINTVQKIMELGKNPGLGVRALHEQGITGKGVNVAIIDQNLVTDHPEYAGKFIQYKDLGTKQSPDEGSMHGPAVASLLVGETIGTAPDAGLYYAALPSWLADAQYYADALNWLISENSKLPADQKIRVVSVSAAPSGNGSPFTKNNDAWDAAFQLANEQGILVLDCTQEKGLTLPCHYDRSEQENPAACVPGFAGAEIFTVQGRIHIPASFRTTAEEYHKGDFQYQYDGQGGLSWTTPYLAGVLAMGWQIRPELTADEMLAILFETAYEIDGLYKIIYPEAFIAELKTQK